MVEWGEIMSKGRNMETEEKLQAHVFISGNVQGVNFRWSTKREAQRLEITGWVRNLPDGRVEAVFEGDSEAIHKMIGWCYDGPPASQVSNVEVNYSAPTEEFSAFRISGW